ncbi:hypothetical protein ACH5RR_002867 [Cinchona calisaya]|uniref:Reverse transcriptase zinc-binding domain-containing protein n=1 Tax=Cinchona calisaya TaxID=153742 RepID=A0ABD3AT76_9GENT
MDNMNQYGNLVQSLESLLDQEDLIWRQRSKQHWYKEGDRNMNFFHVSPIIRHRANMIKALRDQHENWSTEPREFEDIIMSHFSDSTSKNLPQNDLPRVLERVSSKVLVKMNIRLLWTFMELEVTTALSHMHHLKSPGLDGFSPTFYQKYWSVISSRTNASTSFVWILDLIDVSSRTWKREVIETLCWTREVEAIMETEEFRQRGIVEGEGNSGVDEVWRKIWKLYIPTKIKHFLWRALRNILPTRVKLMETEVKLETEANITNQQLPEIPRQLRRFPWQKSPPGSFERSLGEALSRSIKRVMEIIPLASLAFLLYWDSSGALAAEPQIGSTLVVFYVHISTSL